MVRKVGIQAFVLSENIKSVSFGTGFTEETRIEFGINVFSWYNGVPVTINMDLTLGEFVLPKPNLINRTWYDYNGDRT